MPLSCAYHSAAFRAALLAGLALAAAPAAAVPAGDEACRLADLREDRLAAVGPRGELTLASGARAVLAGLHWPEAEPDAAAATAWLERFRGRGLTLSARGVEDRWGRARVDAVADPAEDGSAGDDPVDLAAGLVAAGLAQVDAGESDALCRADLLALEAAPRAARLGLWRAGPRDARDGTALSALDGRFVVAQGRILHVGERPGRTFLDFARRGEVGLTVIVSKRTWRIMQARGLTAATLRGRFARVRGRVEIRRGPVLDLAGEDLIELPEGDEARVR